MPLCSQVTIQFPHPKKSINPTGAGLEIVEGRVKMETVVRKEGRGKDEERKDFEVKINESSSEGQLLGKEEGWL